MRLSEAQSRFLARCSFCPKGYEFTGQERRTFISLKKNGQVKALRGGKKVIITDDGRMSLWAKYVRETGGGPPPA